MSKTEEQTTVQRNQKDTLFRMLAVFLGKNGTGKTTFFDIFGFLHDCLNSNVRTALARRGGYKEVVSREQTGDIISVSKSSIH